MEGIIYRRKNKCQKCASGRKLTEERMGSNEQRRDIFLAGYKMLGHKFNYAFPIDIV